jgi:alpha-L-fucosidase 2
VKVPRLRPFLGLALVIAGPTSRGAEVRTDVLYGRAGGVDLRLDASVPDGPGPFPVAILVHGGGWSGGDKSGGKGSADIAPWFGMLTEARFTWFSINYRMAPAHRWPACLEDLRAAIRWVKANAPAYKGDPDRIVLFGHSAGGQLVCQAAVLADDGTRVRAVVAYAPVTDLVRDSAHRGGLSASLQGLFGLPAGLTDRARSILSEASPIDHVAPGDPPFLLVQGNSDRTVPPEQTAAFLGRLKAAGVPCSLLTIPGGAHVFGPWDRFDPGYRRAVVSWLRKALGE